MSELAQRLRNTFGPLPEYELTEGERRFWASELLAYAAAAELDRLTAEVAGVKADAELWLWAEDKNAFPRAEMNVLANAYTGRWVVLNSDGHTSVGATPRQAISRAIARAALAAQEPTAQEQK